MKFRTFNMRLISNRPIVQPTLNHFQKFLSRYVQCGVAEDDGLKRMYRHKDSPILGNNTTLSTTFIYRYKIKVFVIYTRSNKGIDEIKMVEYF